MVAASGQDCGAALRSLRELWRLQEESGEGADAYKQWTQKLEGKIAGQSHASKENGKITDAATKVMGDIWKHGHRGYRKCFAGYNWSLVYELACSLPCWEESIG